MLSMWECVGWLWISDSTWWDLDVTKWLAVHVKDPIRMLPCRKHGRWWRSNAVGGVGKYPCDEQASKDDVTISFSTLSIRMLKACCVTWNCHFLFLFRIPVAQWSDKVRVSPYIDPDFISDRSQNQMSNSPSNHSAQHPTNSASLLPRALQTSPIIDLSRHFCCCWFKPLLIHHPFHVSVLFDSQLLVVKIKLRDTKLWNLGTFLSQSIIHGIKVFDPWLDQVTDFV